MAAAPDDDGELSTQQQSCPMWGSPQIAYHTVGQAQDNAAMFVSASFDPRHIKAFILGENRWGAGASTSLVQKPGGNYISRVLGQASVCVRPPLPPPTLHQLEISTKKLPNLAPNHGLLWQIMALWAKTYLTTSRTRFCQRSVELGEIQY